MWGPGYDNYPVLESSLFAAVRLTKNADIDKYKHSGYGIGFDRCGTFSGPSSRLRGNFIISGLHMSSFVHIDNKGKYILFLGEGPTQGLDDTKLTAEKSIKSITESAKKFC